ncbi:MAG: hypothetical protein MH137_02980 [Flavobacteriales bacterium]|nr:hypothetical protein [Flavobacteriales bacterium]
MKWIFALLLNFLLIFHIHAGIIECKDVFDRLVLVMGQGNMPKPRLVIENSPNLVAVTFPTGEIKVGNRFIGLCSRFQKDSVNALAHVLSHELVHYYRRHAWAHGFGAAYADTDWGKKIAKEESNKAFMELYETQADQLGVLYAFSAGYNTIHVAPFVLDSIYTWFHGGKDSIPGYPPLAQRKLTAEKSAKLIANLIPVFETGNLLQSLSYIHKGETQSFMLDFSGFCYEHILSSDIHTPEIFNNLAAVKILKSNLYNTSITATLKLPLILDGNSLLYEISGTRDGSDYSEMLNMLSSEAFEHLDRCLKIEPAYWPARINKLVLLLKLEKLGSCEDEIRQPINQELIKSLPQFKNYTREIQAVIAYLKNDKTLAKKLFAEVEKNGSLTAAENLLMLEGKFDLRSKNQEEWDVDTSEKWMGKYVGFSLRDYDVDTEKMALLNNQNGYILYKNEGDYLIYELNQKLGRGPFRKVRFAVSQEESSYTSKGIKPGSTAKSIKTAYGEPKWVSEGTLHSYWYYPVHKLVFMLNQPQNKVHSWYYYSVK